MAKNDTKKNKRKPELTILIFVLVAMALIVSEIFSNIVSQLLG